MGKALFSASKTLRDPSALRPQGDVWGVILSEAKDLRGPSALRPQGDRGESPFGLSPSGLRLRVT